MKIGELTPEQMVAVRAWVNLHTAYEAQKARASETAAKRLDALDLALELGVPSTVLAAEVGLTHGRIHQMAAQLGRATKRRRGKQPMVVAAVEVGSNGSKPVRAWIVQDPDTKEQVFDGVFETKADASGWVKRNDGVEV